ncbi:MAG: acyl-CoA dehydrogenase [Nevskia sp.]|nr:acyl-CoA dehydrogenase [Nevskia sp.]
MEFAWSEDEVEFRQTLRAFIREHVRDEDQLLVPGEDPYSDSSIEFCRKLAAKGWLVPHWPKEYGGSDASSWIFAITSEELWAAGEPRGSQYMNVNWIGPAIIAAGTPEQKAQHLGRIASGDVLWCQGFSELDAGSDLVAMQTFAKKDGDHYVVNGQKIWTSYASKAEYCFLLAKTRQDGDPQHSISIFLVPMNTPGVRVEVVPTMLDIHTVHRLTFENVRVPASCRMGAENAGWPIVRDALSDERVGTPRYARAEEVLNRVVEIAAERGLFADGRLQRMASHASAACRAARLLSYQVRQSRSKGAGAGPEAYIGRVAIVRAEREVAEFAVEVVGEESLLGGSLVDGEFRTAMIAGLGGGSYEMQLNLIARLWLRLPKGA